MIDSKRAAREVLKLPPQNVTVSLWMTAWREFFPTERNAVTIRNDAYMLEPFREKHGRKLLSAVTVLMAQQWAVRHPSQVRRLRSVWEKAVLMHLIDVNVWSAVRLPPKEKPPGYPVPSLEQLDAALERARARGRWWIEFADFCEVAAFTGARQAGMIALGHAEVDLAARRMTVTEKGEKTRTIVLTDRSLAAMERSLPRHCNAAHVFLSPQRRRLDRTAVSRWWGQIRGDFDGPFHSLKHFAGTWLDSQGVDERDIAIQLGHFDQSGRPYTKLLRRVYVHPDHDEALARIERVLNG